MLEEGGSSGSVFLNVFRIEAWLELLNYIVRRQRAMVGIGLPCSSSLPAVGSAVRMRSRKSDTGVGGGTSRLWLLMDGLAQLGSTGLAQMHGAVCPASMSVSTSGLAPSSTWMSPTPIHRAVVGPPNPTPRRQLQDFPLSASGPASGTAQKWWQARGGPGAVAGSWWLVDGKEMVAGCCAPCVRSIRRVLRLFSFPGYFALEEGASI